MDLALLHSFQKSSGLYRSNIDVSDPWVSRGWESSHVIVGDLRGVTDVENLVMRTVGYCALVKRRQNSYSDFSEDFDSDSDSDIE